MIKRILAILLVCAMILIGMTACAKDKNKENESTTEDIDADWKEAAKAEMTKRYGITDFSNYQILFSNLDYGGRVAAFRFFLHGYETNEEYQVVMKYDKSIADVKTNEVGVYSAFQSKVSKQEIEAAQKRLAQKVSESKEDGDNYYYLTIDDEGYLCMQAEIYVYLEIGTDAEGGDRTGCGIDHDHIYFTERLCAKP